MKNQTIITLSNEIGAEKAKPDVDKQALIDDIIDYCEVTRIHSIDVGANGPNGVNYVAGVYSRGGVLILNGRPHTLASAPTQLAVETVGDLIQMRDALARVLSDALASIKQQKGTK